MPAAVFATFIRNASAQAKIDQLGNGAKMEIRKADETVLSRHTLGSPFAPAPVNGVITGNLPADADGLVSGLAGKAVILKADGTTVGMTLTVGVAGSNAPVILGSLNVVAGVPVTVNTISITEGNA